MAETGTLPTNAYQFFNTQVFNAQIPKEGPRALAFTVPFSELAKWQANLYLTQAGQQISQISSAYVDNSDNAFPVDISVSVINVSYRFPPNSQGFIPISVPKNATVTYHSEGAKDIRVCMYNVPMPAFIWDVSDNGGNESVACPAGATTPLGAAGTFGDYLDGLLVIPATTSPGAVQIQDGGSAAETVFAGGAASVGSLVPFFIPITSNSLAGGWAVITGANVTVRATGQFTDA